MPTLREGTQTAVVGGVVVVGVVVGVVMGVTLMLLMLVAGESGAGSSSSVGIPCLGGDSFSVCNS